MDCKANPNFADENGKTALMWACEKNHTALAQYLVERNAQPNCVNDKTEKTPLMWACENNNTELAQSLLKQNADPNLQVKTSRMPLMWACSKNNMELAQSLLEQKADPNLADAKGNTPLMCAASAGHRKLVRTLIEDCRPASLELKDHQGKTALDTAIGKEKFETVSLLLSLGAIIRNPQELFNFLKICYNKKPQDPNLLVSFECLCEQLDNENSLYVEANLHLTKLQEMNQKYKCNAGVRGVFAASHSLIDLIAQYDAPLERAHLNEFRISRNRWAFASRHSLIDLIAPYDAPLERAHLNEFRISRKR